MGNIKCSGANYFQLGNCVLQQLKQKSILFPAHDTKAAVSLRENTRQKLYNFFDSQGIPKVNITYEDTKGKLSDDLNDYGVKSRKPAEAPEHVVKGKEANPASATPVSLEQGPWLWMKHIRRVCSPNDAETLKKFVLDFYRDYKLNPNHLLTVIAFETRKTFSPQVIQAEGKTKKQMPEHIYMEKYNTSFEDILNQRYSNPSEAKQAAIQRPKSLNNKLIAFYERNQQYEQLYPLIHAVGLVQFTEITTDSLHTTLPELYHMNMVEQLSYVKRYLVSNQNKYASDSFSMMSVGDLYMLIISPANYAKRNHNDVILSGKQATTNAFATTEDKTTRASINDSINKYVLEGKPNEGY